MKTFLLLITVFTISAALHSQPVLKANDINPVVGDQIIMANAKTVGVKVPATGKNVTWNYSKLKDTANLIDTTKYLKPSKTPFDDDFPQANIASTTSSAPDFYVYLKTTNKYLQSFGSESDDSKSTWDPPYRLAIYPMKYGTKYTDTSTITVKTGGSKSTSGFRDSGEVVGYGTLKLTKNRTFTDVLMVRTTTIITIKIGNIKFTTVSHGINFFVAGYHSPVLSFSLDQANHITFISYSKDADAKGNFDLVDDESLIAANANTGSSLYPNPASSKFTINMNKVIGKSVTAIYITDIDGRNVYTKKGNIMQAESINCAAFKEGTYLVTIQMSDGSSEFKKLFVKKD